MMVFFRLLLLTFFFAVPGLAKTKSPGLIKIVSGRSLGVVSLGQSRQELIDLGFGPDGAMDPISYLENDGLLVRMEDNKVAQVYVDRSSFERLRFHGKKFPKNTTAKSLRKFFKGCGKIKKRPVGLLIYCEHAGIELTYSKDPSTQGQLEGLAVVPGHTHKQDKARGHTP
jgi:hypothetical protein